LACDADDVLLASNIAIFGEKIIRDVPDLATPATRNLYDASNKQGCASVIMLAKLVRRIHEHQHAELNDLAFDLTNILTAVLGTMAPKTTKRFGKHPHG
jgi:hypothetical protein